MPKDNQLMPGMIRTLETMTEAIHPYQEAVSIMEQHTSNFLDEPLTNRLGMIDQTRTHGLFNSTLAQSLTGMFIPSPEITDIHATLKALGDSFSGLINLDIYRVSQSALEQVAASLESSNAIQKILTVLEPLNHMTPIVDTTWLHGECSWLIDKSLLSSFDLGKIDGLSSNFAQLCVLEQQTSQLNGVPEELTSAASQIASIVSAFDQSLPMNWRYDDLMTSSQLLNDYCELATKQHEMLQKATETSEIEWRLGVIDTASKYVDRQVTWSLGLADVFSDEDIYGEAEDKKTSATALSLIPTHIGYTRRHSIHKTPTEGLEESSIVAITEKGKRIADYFLKINRLRLDKGQERVFHLSETICEGMLSVGGVVCTSDEQLGKIIDCLYFMFYENIKHIKLLIGDGDEGKGDRLVRAEEVYECIFNVKTIRSDLRHDLDHGDENERKKKLKSVGDCYRKYCNNRPMKMRDYKLLQEKLYDEVIALEERLIQKLLGELE